MQRTIDLYVMMVDDDKQAIQRRWSYDDAVLSLWNPCLLYLGKRQQGLPRLPADWKQVSCKDVLYARRVLARLGTPYDAPDKADLHDTERMLRIIEDALGANQRVFIHQY